MPNAKIFRRSKKVLKMLGLLRLRLDTLPTFQTNNKAFEKFYQNACQDSLNIFTGFRDRRGFAPTFAYFDAFNRLRDFNENVPKIISNSFEVRTFSSAL